MNNTATSNKFKLIIKISFIMYILLLLKFVVFKYTLKDCILILTDWNVEAFYNHLKFANFEPFYTINNYVNIWKYSDSFNISIFLNLFGNIIAFIPLGIYLPLSYRMFKSFILMLIISLLIPTVIEGSQLITTLGSFDIDDIILNSLGIIIGYLIYKLISLIYKFKIKTW